MKLMSGRRGGVNVASAAQRIQKASHLACRDTYPTRTILMAGALHVLFAGGGEASHVSPGISVARQLTRRMPEAVITFSGPSNSAQRHRIRSSGFRYLGIPSRPAPRNPAQALRFVTDNLAGYCAAKWNLREQDVSLVVGLGGYDSGPMVKAAIRKGTPVVLLEQDLMPGKLTQSHCQRSALVCTAFEQTKPHLHVLSRSLCAGFPVSPGFEELYRNRRDGHHPDCTVNGSHGGSTKKKRLVVLGGVGGSQALNKVVPGALRQLGSVVDEWQVIHQTGERQLQETERKYQKAKLEVLAVTSIDELASIVFDSDLIICRAGGTTLAELALAEVPALLVPLAEGDHGRQLANAKAFRAAGACRLVEEVSQISALQSSMTRELRELMTDASLRNEMRSKIAAYSRPSASADIAEAICETLYGKRTATRMAA